MIRQKFDNLIVGGGIIGLSLMYKLIKNGIGKDILLLEKNYNLMEETSSRNSEVIHSGIYYPIGSLKSDMCLKGKIQLVETLKNNKLGYNNVGKLIVSRNSDESEYLNQLKSQASKLNIKSEFVSKFDLDHKYNYLKVSSALFLSETSIFDSHEFANYLLSFIYENSQSNIMTGNELIDINFSENDPYYQVTVKDIRNNQIFEILVKNIFNCSGLNCIDISELFYKNLKTPSNYKIEYYKGSYFKLKNKLKFIDKLIYPVPNKNLKSLGIHLTLDLNGCIKFGPNIQKLNNKGLNYTVDPSIKDQFYEEIKSYLQPSLINLNDLEPDYCGIRPKVYKNDTKFNDFIIENEAKLNRNSNKNFINLLGIESPGLTSCLSIADYAINLLK